MDAARTEKQALVVDDDDTVMEHVSKLLLNRGFTVAQEYDGMAALQRCRTEKFAIVVCDIRMPRLSGISFVRNLRQSELNTTIAKSATPIVMMSSLSDNATKREITAAGTPHLLLKPISGAALDTVLIALGLLANPI
jgi:CheY-like chemotaxis protein